MKNIEKFLIVLMVLTIIILIVLLRISLLYNELKSEVNLIAKNKSEDIDTTQFVIKNKDESIELILNSIESLDSQVKSISEEITTLINSNSEKESVNEQILSKLNNLDNYQQELNKQFSSVNRIEEEINSIINSNSEKESVNEQILSKLNNLDNYQQELNKQFSSVNRIEEEINIIINTLVDNDAPNDFNYSAPSNEEEFTYTHIRFLNALNKNPKDMNLWEEYVSFILTYGNYSDFQIAEESLSSAILFIPEEDIDQLLNLSEKVKEAIASLEIEKPIVYNDFYENCSKLENLFLSEECIAFSDIKNNYNKLLNQYSSMDDVDEDEYEIFSRITDYYTVIDSIASIVDVANYWIDTDNNTYEVCQILSILENSLIEAKSAYSQLGISSESIIMSIHNAENAIEKLNSIARNLVLKEAEESKPNTRIMPNEQAKLEYTKYINTLERLSAYLPNDELFQKDITNKILDCNKSINGIIERQSQRYQIWVYNTIIDAKNKVSGKKDKTSFNEFFSINSTLIVVPEIYSLYSDILTKVKSYIGDERYNEFVKSATSQGLKSYEDF